jgi:lysophospholipase L1-like esterase
MITARVAWRSSRALALLRCAAIAALLCLPLAGCGEKTPAIPRLAPDAIVLAFGDSLTSGYGAPAGASYPAALEQLIGRKVVNAGVPGEVTAGGLARLPGVLEQVRPQLVVLIHGGNDFLRRLDERTAAQNLRAMVRLSRDQGVGVILLGVPKPGLIPSAPAFFREVATEFGLPYDDGTLAEILTDNALKSDPIHPNAEGYARLAAGVAGLLRKAKAI